MRIIVGSRVFLKDQFKDEDELERVVQSHYDSIFGDEAIYVPKKSLETSGGVGTVPEAIVIDLSAEKWYIIEVELARHGTWTHIAPQVSKQVVAADNQQARRGLTRIALSEIERSEGWKKKFEQKDIPEIRIQQVLDGIMEKDPIIVVPIDAIPSDFQEFGRILKHEFVPILVERYAESGSDEVAYRIASDRIIASPEPPEEVPTTKEKLITEEGFLKQCDEPGRIFYSRLKKLAEQKGCKIEPRTEAFSFYVTRKGAKPFCPIVIWPQAVTVLKWNLNEQNGVTPEILSSFRDNIMKIGTFENKYDTMKLPSMSTRSGDISEYEIDLFVSALRGLIEAVA